MMDAKLLTLHLQGVRSYAEHLQRDAYNLDHHVKQLVARPRFDTDAEHELENAELMLEAALQRVKAAREEMSSKPIAIFEDRWNETVELLSLAEAAE